MRLNSDLFTVGLWDLENIASFLMTPHESDSNTAGLWHLDGTTSDVVDASAHWRSRRSSARAG